jgi:phosphoribosylaminoimidazole (AIR) synthetase
MLKTFNCGIGFCLIANKKNIRNIMKIFTKNYQPYQIGFISKGKNKSRIFGTLKW